MMLVFFDNITESLREVPYAQTLTIFKIWQMIIHK